MQQNHISKHDKEFLFYLAKRKLLGQVLEASLNSWTQLYRLNSLLPLSGNPKSFLTSFFMAVFLGAFVEVTKFWIPFENVSPRTETAMHALAGGSLQIQNNQAFPQKRLFPLHLKHYRISPTFQRLILLISYRQILRVKLTFPGQFCQRSSTNAADWSHNLYFRFSLLCFGARVCYWGDISALWVSASKYWS